MRWTVLSDLEDWDGPVDEVPEARTWLSEAGFTVVGWMGTEGGAPDFYTGEDARLDVMSAACATEIWVDADGTTAALPSHWVDGPWIRFCSQEGDGTVVDTRRRPARAPHTRFQDAREAVAGRSPLHRALMALVPGDPVVAVPRCPPTDLTLALVGATSPAEVWAHHRATLRAPVPLGNLEQVVDLQQERFVRLATERWREDALAQKVSTVLGVAALATLALGIGLMPPGWPAWLVGVGAGALVVWLWSALSQVVGALAHRVAGWLVERRGRRAPDPVRVACPFCHAEVPRNRVATHAILHTEVGRDGQQGAYVTLPAEERSEVSIEGEPTIYVHTVCGTQTEMPEDIIRSYLKDPSLYGTTTHCCGCERQVHQRECVWVETGEDLQSYAERLEARHV